MDRSEWVMTPQTVNAVNLPAMNAMNFPAAILQPPYFDPKRPLAMDYGAMGAIIGHEVSHSFDNQGALFDATGRLHNWWTPEDFKHFERSSKQLVAQYDAYKPFPDLAVKGQQTLGENIADVAGLTAAYDAYQLSLHGKPAPVVQGLSGDQQFFVSFAQSWRGKAREPAMRNRILTDGHAPAAVSGVDGAEHRRVVSGVRREAGAGAVPGAGGSGASLVSACDPRVGPDPVESRARGPSGGSGRTAAADRRTPRPSARRRPPAGG